MTESALHPHIPEHRRSQLINMLHTWLLLAGSLALLIACAWTLAGPAGIAYALVFGGISLYAIRRISPQMVLAMYKARPWILRSIRQVSMVTSGTTMRMC